MRDFLYFYPHICNYSSPLASTLENLEPKLVCILILLCDYILILPISPVTCRVGVYGLLQILEISESVYLSSPGSSDVPLFSEYVNMTA